MLEVDNLNKSIEEFCPEIISVSQLPSIQQQQSDIRKQLQDVRNAPKDRYNAQQKRAKIEQLLNNICQLPPNSSASLLGYYILLANKY